MTGLLPTDIDDPRNQGLLGTALAMLAASGPSPQRRTFGQILGGAGLQGMQRYDQARLLRQRDEESKRRNQLTDMQLQRMQEQLANERQSEQFFANPANFMRSEDVYSATDAGPDKQTVMSPLPQNELALKFIQSRNPQLARAGASLLMKPETPEKQFMVVGNSVFVPSRGEFLMPPQSPKDQQEKESEYERMVRRVNDPATPPEIRTALQRRIESINTNSGDQKLIIEQLNKQQARGQVSGNLSALYDAYKELERAGGAIKTGASPVENIANYALSTPPGQIVGKALGTETQAARNRIEQLRPMLIQEIRQATQMGAKGLDSNAELNFYLQAATDTTKDVDSNLAAIEVLDRAYGLGLGIASKKEARDKLRNEFSKSSGDASGVDLRALSNIPIEAIQELRKNPKLADQFDAYYGQGMSRAVLGR